MATQALPGSSCAHSTWAPMIRGGLGAGRRRRRVTAAPAAPRVAKSTSRATSGAGGAMERCRRSARGTVTVALRVAPVRLRSAASSPRVGWIWIAGATRDAVGWTRGGGTAGFASDRVDGDATAGFGALGARRLVAALTRGDEATRRCPAGAVSAAGAFAAAGATRGVDGTTAWRDWGGLAGAAAPGFGRTLAVGARA